MNPFVVVVIAFVLYSVASWMSYHPTHRERNWFLFVMGSISLCGGLLWAWVVRLCATKRDLFTASVAWDVAVMAAYSVLPLLAFGVKLSPMSWFGFGMVVVGAVMVKHG